MKNPIAQFTQWFNEASACKDIADATAMTLATADKNAMPAARIVLLKGYDEKGFVFYTNLESHKSNDLKTNPQAALCFYWSPLNKQIRIAGKIEAVSAAEADEYFATRPRESQIGAWSSQQSRPLDSRETLVKAVAANTKKYEGKTVPRPPHWSGWRLIPVAIEFWQQGDFRLHHREFFTRQGSGWEVTKLYP